MQNYIDQVEKYLKAQSFRKVYLSDNQKDLFFLKSDGPEICLYYLSLCLENEVIDLNASVKIIDYDFTSCNLEFIRYFEEGRQLFISLDEKNNEFFNLFSIRLDEPQLKQVTNVKFSRSFNWTKDRSVLYFLNRYPIEGGLFKSEFYKLNLQTAASEMLFDDAAWTYKVGWGNFKLTESENAFLVTVDKENRRELQNFVLIPLADVAAAGSALHPSEFPKLLPPSFEDGTSQLVGKVTKNGFYFVNDSNQYENLYFYDFSSKALKTITDEQWVNLSIGYCDFGHDSMVVFAEPIKATNQTRLYAVHLIDQSVIEKKLDGNFIASYDQGFLLKNAIDETPTYILFNEKMEFTQRFAKYSGENLVHGTFESVNYPSFDGLNISAYFIQPKKPLRGVAIIAFYGGENYYHFHDQLLLENGIALFSPAVRGSWGWGKEWEDHLKGDLGGKEILDIIWAAKFIKEKLKLPENKIGVWGASHGGYAVLRAITLPENFYGVNTDFNFGFAICECGFADLEDFHQTSRIADWLVDLLGPYPENKKLYQERSPIHFFNRLKTPLFIRHGTTDSRVPLSTVEGFIAKIRNSNIESDIMIQSDQGHHTSDPEKLKIERARILKFLESI